MEVYLPDSPLLCRESSEGERTIHLSGDVRMASDTYVERTDVPVMRVRADFRGGGPAVAFRILESHLPSLKGRRFYGTFRETAAGEEYFACVQKIATDDPAEWKLEEGVIPGGLYARRRFPDWEKNIGLLPSTFAELIRLHIRDPTRPSIEFYRSHSELHLLLPVLRRSQGSDPI